MKNLLKGGKLWTILSALLFIVACSLVVYAAGGSGARKQSDPYYLWKHYYNDNVLSADDWDVLMDKLDKLGTGDMGVPKGAVMAFDAYECPPDWEYFSEANDRVIRGRKAEGEKKWHRTVGGNTEDKIKLTISQLPPHDHYIANNHGLYYNGFRDSCGGVGTYGYTDDRSEKRYLDTDSHCGSDYDLSFHLPYGPEVPNVGNTSMVGGGDEIDISDRYIRLIYCKKK